jgi:hypothetical protein
MGSLRLVLGILALSVVVTPIELDAQRLTIAPQVAPANYDLALVSAHLRFSVAASRERVGDYRLEGTAIGALFFGALGTWIGTEACRNQPTPIGSGSSSSCSGVTVGLVGVVMGAGVGYMLGRITPKYR